MAYFAAVGSNDRIIGEWWSGECIKRNGCILIYVLCRKIPGETEEKHDKSQAGGYSDFNMKQALDDCKSEELSPE
jgi:hypothetical protein